MAIPLRLRSIFFTTLRWTAVWAAIGLLLGLAMTIGRVPPIAEPGAPSGYAFYVFWIPVCLGAGSVFGLLLGLIYACLVTAIDVWMPRAETRQSFMTTYGWRLMCGAIAGAAVGFPTLKREGMWVVGIGMASALVSGYLNRSKPRSLEL